MVMRCKTCVRVPYSLACEQAAACVALLALDTTLCPIYPPCITGGLLEQSWEAQLRELEGQLAASSAPWKLAIGHHPPHRCLCMNSSFNRVFGAVRCEELSCVLICTQAVRSCHLAMRVRALSGLHSL